MTRGSEAPLQHQRGHRRGVKRNPLDQLRGHNKRERTPSISAGSNTVTLMHYFNKAPASTPASNDATKQESSSGRSSAIAADSSAEAALQRDIEHAIALSLEQESTTISKCAYLQNAHGTGGTDEGIVSENVCVGDTLSIPENLPKICPETIKIHEAETEEAIRSGDGKKEKSIARQTEDIHIKSEALLTTDIMQPMTCPICEKDFEDRNMDKINLHINRCLDTGTQCSQQQQQQQHQPAAADKNSSSVAVMGHVFTPKDVNVLSPSPLKDSAEKKPSSSRQSSRTRKIRNPRKPCPYHKWMEDTEYTVDAFSYGKIPGCQGYFLSHYHSDHYQGLSKTWTHGPIYCSKVTANLVKQELGVAPEYVIPLSLDEKHRLSDRVVVTLIDANHCPGSVLFLFEIAHKEAGGQPIRHLHTGDFRASPRMCLHPALREGPIKNLYLDTTYLDAHYSFPGQEEVVDAACEVAESICSSGIEKSRNNEIGGLFQWLKTSACATFATVTSTANDDTTDPEVLADEIEGTLASFKTERRNRPKSVPRVLIVVGTYTIGKEKVFFHLAKRLKLRVFAKEKKRRILECQENSELSSLLTDDPYEAQIHVMSMWDLKIAALESYRQTFGSHFSSVLAFRPTGWTFGGGGYQVKPASSTPALNAIIEPPADRAVRLWPDKSSTNTVKVYGIPYSEHSSFRELAAFICSLDIVRVIPTVNMTKPESQQRQYAVLKRWQYEKQVIGIKSVPYPSEDYW